MTREIRITAEQYSADPDCYLDPDDPVHAITLASTLGISLEQAECRMAARARERAGAEVSESEEMKYARERGIKPGSVAWNTLFDTK